jgi:hypothetical protein
LEEYREYRGCGHTDIPERVTGLKICRLLLIEAGNLWVSHLEAFLKVHVGENVRVGAHAYECVGFSGEGCLQSLGGREVFIN